MSGRLGRSTSPNSEKDFVISWPRRGHGLSTYLDEWGRIGWTFKLLGYPKVQRKSSHNKINRSSVRVEYCTCLIVNHT